MLSYFDLLHFLAQGRSVLFLILAEPLVALWSVIVVFPGRTRLFLCKNTASTALACFYVKIQPILHSLVFMSKYSQYWLNFDINTSECVEMLFEAIVYDALQTTDDKHPNK